MASPVNDAYSAASGITIYGGRFTFDTFDSVSVFSEDPAGIPYTTPNQVMVLQLHASSGSNYAIGRQYRANVSGYMAKDSYNVHSFYTARTTFLNTMQIRPMDNYPGATPFETMHMGYKYPDGFVHLMTRRRAIATYRWAMANLTQFDPSKTCVAGGSMGGWGTLNVGLRHPELFAALYADRPRWRYNGAFGKVQVQVYGVGPTSVDVGASPNLAPQDGGGSYAAFMDHIAYVANTANKVAWIGWCVGWEDGFTTRQDHVDAVAALRSAKRGFAFYWNAGNHSVGSIPHLITNSYPYGTFQIGKGYPLFTDHSGDGDPAVDETGSINGGLSFRNVVESASGWACEVTSILGARTVKVEPISEVFLASVSKQTVTIPAANTWVPVSFSV